jgi:hypothetical protein
LERPTAARDALLGDRVNDLLFLVIVNIEKDRFIGVESIDERLPLRKIKALFEHLVRPYIDGAGPRFHIVMTADDQRQGHRNYAGFHPAAVQ